MVPPAESEPVQVTVTALINCHEQKEPPVPLVAQEQEQSPAPGMDVTEKPITQHAESEPAQVVVIAQSTATGKESHLHLWQPQSMIILQQQLWRLLKGG